MKTKLKKLIVGIPVLLALCASGQDATQYDINDPRNPNCPCHKYQKLANEEYKKLLAQAGAKTNDAGISRANYIPRKRDLINLPKENIEQGVSWPENTSISNIFNPTAGNNSAESGFSSSNSSGISSSGSGFKKDRKDYHKRLKRKAKCRKLPLWLRRLAYGAKDICREARIVSACYSWK